MFLYKTKENFSNNAQKKSQICMNSKFRRWGGHYTNKNLERKISGLQKIREKFKLAYRVFAVAIFMGMFSVSGFATRNIEGYNQTTGKYNYVYFGGVVNGATYKNPTSSDANATSSYVADTNSGHSYQDNGTTKYALKFRVLDTTANDGETPALFMLTEYVIGERRWDVTSSEAASGHIRQEWTTSEMRRWLNGYNEDNEVSSEIKPAEYINSVLPTCFELCEQAAIMETRTHEAGEALVWWTNGSQNYWVGTYEGSKVNGTDNLQAPLKSNQLEGDKIFF